MRPSQEPPDVARRAGCGKPHTVKVAADPPSRMEADGARYAAGGVFDVVAGVVRLAVLVEHEPIEDQELEHEHDREGTEVAAVDQ